MGGGGGKACPPGANSACAVKHRVAAGFASIAASWACSFSGSHPSSLSRKATRGARANAMPRLRAAAAPVPPVVSASR